MYIVFIVLNIDLKAGNQLGKHAVLEAGPQLSYTPFNDSILFYRLTSFWFILNDKVVATIIFLLYYKHYSKKHSFLLLLFFIINFWDLLSL